MVIRRRHRPASIVDFLLGRAGDAVVFEARIASKSCAGKNGVEVVLWEIHADIAVEIPVGRVTGIPLPCAPDLLAGFPIASKDRWACGGEIRGVNGEAGTGLSIHEPVGVGNEPAKVGFLEDAIDVGHIRAFGQPNALRIAAETLTVVVAPDEHLGPHGLRDNIHQGQKAVRGRTGDDLNDPIFL